MLLKNNKASNDLIIDILIKNNFAEIFKKQNENQVKNGLDIWILVVLFSAFIIFLFFSPFSSAHFWA